MLPEAETPQEWMAIARSDLAVAASAHVPGAVAATACFLAQQAAEKSLKAVLLGRGVSFSRTHNVGELIDLLPPDLGFPQELQDSALLTRYAVDTRYPGVYERPSWDDYERALRLAEAVVRWTEEIIGG